MKIGCANYNIGTKKWVAKPGFSLLVLQILGAQMRTLRKCAPCALGSAAPGEQDVIREQGGRISENN